MALAYVGLGSNVGDAHANLEAAIGALSAFGSIRARSSFYLSAPWGVREQEDFLNAVVALETSLSPFELLRASQQTERDLGRIETYRWGPRVIDVDILTYDDLLLNEPELTLPHPRLFERGFVLAPLAEIDVAYLPAYERLSSQERLQAKRV